MLKVFDHGPCLSVHFLVCVCVCLFSFFLPLTKTKEDYLNSSNFGSIVLSKRSALLAFLSASRYLLLIDTQLPFSMVSSKKRKWIQKRKADVEKKKRINHPWSTKKKKSTWRKSRAIKGHKRANSSMLPSCFAYLFPFSFLVHEHLTKSK